MKYVCMAMFGFLASVTWIEVGWLVGSHPRRWAIVAY